jgi:hypothetical protein
VKRLLTIVMFASVALAQSVQVQSGKPAPGTVQMQSGTPRAVTGILTINGDPGPNITINGLNGITVSSGGPGIININGSGTGGFTASGDLSGTASVQQVIGLLSHPLPALSPGFLEWNGTNWVFGAGGTFVPTSPFTITNAGNSFTITVPPTGNPVLSSTTGGLNIASLFVTNLAGTGVSCLQTDALGNVSRTNAACGTGAGGITGPATTTVGHMALWGNTTGTTLTDGGAVPSPGTSFTAGGDLSGSATSQQVIGIHGTSVPTPGTAGFLEWTGSAWAFSAPSGTGIASINGNTNTAQTISNGSGITVDSTTTPGTTVITNSQVNPRSCVPGGVSPTLTLTCTPQTTGPYTEGEAYSFSFPTGFGLLGSLSATISVDGRGAIAINAGRAISLPSVPATGFRINATYTATPTPQFLIGCPTEYNPGAYGASVPMIGGGVGVCPPTNVFWRMTNTNPLMFYSSSLATPSYIGGASGAITGPGVSSSVSSVIFSPSDIKTANSDAVYTGGRGLFKGSDYYVTSITTTGQTIQTGPVEVRPGLANINTGSNIIIQINNSQFEVGGLRGITLPGGSAVCVTGSAPAAGFGPVYGPCTPAQLHRWVGIFQPGANGWGMSTLIVVQGDSMFASFASVTWTAGDFICLDAANTASNGTFAYFLDSTTDCPAGEQAGIVTFTDTAAGTAHYGVIARR